MMNQVPRNPLRVICWNIRSTAARKNGWEKKVPSILLSGDHKKVDEWRREQAILRTIERRPDLLKKAELTKKKQIRYQEYLLNDGRNDIMLYGMTFCKKDAELWLKECKLKIREKENGRSLLGIVNGRCCKALS